MAKCMYNTKPYNFDNTGTRVLMLCFDRLITKLGM